MAKEQITKITDDLDGTEGADTVKFGLDGNLYEIDLSAKNAGKLRSALAPFIEKATKVDQRRAVTIGGRTAVARGRGNAAAEREQNKAIRTWAQRKGLAVAPRGRIKQDIVDQYHREAGR